MTRRRSWAPSGATPSADPARKESLSGSPRRTGTAVARPNCFLSAPVPDGGGAANPEQDPSYAGMDACREGRALKNGGRMAAAA